MIRSAPAGDSPYHAANMNPAGGITRFAPAKINLTLAVGPRRADGFHPLESLVTLLDFGDYVTLIPRPDERVVIECETPGIPTDEANLAARAARRLREALAAASAVAPGVTIRLEKQIPAGAGLGGGSSNAAATLLGLKTLWRIELPAARIAAIGAEIGSDVPLFLSEPERLIVLRGRGEEIELVGHSLLSARVVLAIPPIHSPTAAVYRRFDELPAPPQRPPVSEILTGAQRAWQRGAARRVTESGASNVRSSAAAGSAWSGISPAEPRAALSEPLRLFNDLQPAAEDLNPALHDFHAAVERIAGRPFVMTGSGAVYFAIFPAWENVAAEQICLKLQESKLNGRFVQARMI